MQMKRLRMIALSKLSRLVIHKLMARSPDPLILADIDMNLRSKQGLLGSEYVSRCSVGVLCSSLNMLHRSG